MKFHRVLFFLLIPALLFSCKLPQKVPTYLQDVNSIDSTKKAVSVPEIIIQKGDLLSIQIMSLSTQPEKSDVLYNLPMTGGSSGAGMTSSSGSSGSALNASGYLVDEEGNIMHHRLGVIHAEGLTKKQLADKIKKLLTEPVELLVNPTVIVKLTNFKVTMLGQVGGQGTIFIPSEKVTVLEAIGMAGGITDYGKKTGVKILREKNGQREIGLIDLASKDIFTSPYYYLSQNDVVIVEETNRRLNDTEQARVLQKISFAFTMVTIAATISNLFIKN